MRTPFNDPVAINSGMAFWYASRAPPGVWTTTYGDQTKSDSFQAGGFEVPAVSGKTSVGSNKPVVLPLLHPTVKIKDAETNAKNRFMRCFPFFQKTKT